LSIAHNLSCRFQNRKAGFAAVAAHFSAQMPFDWEMKLEIGNYAQANDVKAICPLHNVIKRYVGGNLSQITQFLD
jgi:hypothetical protein